MSRGDEKMRKPAGQKLRTEVYASVCQSPYWQRPCQTSAKLNSIKAKGAYLKNFDSPNSGISTFKEDGEVASGLSPHNIQGRLG
jgi:hypothetical protein